MRSPFTFFESLINSAESLELEKEIISKHCGMLGTVCYYTVRSRISNTILFEFVITESKHYVCWIRRRSVCIDRTPDFVGIAINCVRGPVNIEKVVYRNRISEVNRIFKEILDGGFTHLGYYMYPDEVIEEFTSSTEKRGA